MEKRIKKLFIIENGSTYEYANVGVGTLFENQASQNSTGKVPTQSWTLVTVRCELRNMTIEPDRLIQLLRSQGCSLELENGTQVTVPPHAVEQTDIFGSTLNLYCQWMLKF